jgi:PAS domain S-box-containing protein
MGTNSKSIDPHNFKSTLEILEETKAALKQIELLGNIGHWEANLITDQCNFSEGLFKILGLEPENAVPSIQLGLSTVHPEDRENATAHLQKSIETGAPYKVEKRIIRPDGEIRFVISEGTVDLDESGKPQRIFVVFKDITDQKLREEELKNTTIHLENILNTTQDLVIIAKEDGPFLKVSKSSEKILGYPSEELIGKSFRNMIHPDDFPATIKNRELILAGFPSSDFRNRYFKKDGSVITLNWSASLDKTTKTIFGIARDITPLLQTQENLRQECQKLAIVLDSSPEVIWALDRDYHLITANNQFLDSMKEVGNWDLKPGANLIYSTPLPKSFTEEWKSYYDRAFAGENFTVTRKVTLMKKDAYQEVNFKPIFENGQVIALGCYSKDITPRKEYEESLRKLNEDLATSNRELGLSNKELEQFAYVASHDLQEPLRMISSFLGLIERRYSGVLDEKGLQYIGFAVDGARRMKNIILDLLEFSRLGNIREDKKTIKTSELLTEVLLLNNKLIQEKQAIIHVGELPDIVGYASPILQVFQNLIVNGLKYQALGQIPEIWIEGQENKDEWLFSVKDNGIGIDPEFQDKIFVIFQRLHQKDQYSGSGIGLAICKKIVEFHDGKIWVESSIGAGSNFFFTLKK